MEKLTVEAKIIVLAVAGAKVEGKVQITNIPSWPVSFLILSYE